MKKSNLLILVIAICTAFLISCGQKSGDSSGSPKEKLSGEWKIVDATGDFAEMNKGTLYIFDGTEKLTTKLGIIETKGTISAISDSTFAVKFEGMQDDFNYNFHFDGNKLIVEPSNSGQVLTMEKQ